MNDKQQLQAMGEHQAEQHMCMAKQIEDLQARLQECANGAAKMQEHRDVFAKQLKEADRQIAEMVELLREAISVISSINHGGEYEVLIDGDDPAFWQRGEWVTWAKLEVLPKLRSALSGKMPDHVADASKMVPEGWQLVPVAPTPEMLSADGCTAHGDDEWCNSRQERRRIWKAMLAAAPKPEPTK